MSNTELIIEALKQAAKRADYYQTGERELFERAADALESERKRLDAARAVIADALNSGGDAESMHAILVKYEWSA